MFGRNKDLCTSRLNSQVFSQQGLEECHGKFSHFHKSSAAGNCQEQAFTLEELDIEAFGGWLGVIWVSSCLSQREEKLLKTIWKSAAGQAEVLYKPSVCKTFCCHC